MKKSIRLYVTGSVQGIFYRNFAKENAERFNIKGFVRNLEDGRVEVFLEGDADKVNQMTELCKQGPKNSKVEKVEIKDERFQDFKDFKILHI
jgi:acylphosphatase